ncbi:MAG: hypothetical protein U0556_07860 [Dehalococcoidia bacterium]
MRCLLAEMEQRVGAVLTYRTAEGKLLVDAVPYYAIIEMAQVVVRQARNAGQTKEALSRLLATLTGRAREESAFKEAERCLVAHGTTAHLSHDVHYYKAKFFPRMVRALINICSDGAGSAHPLVADNFSGSGTTLLEASVLGFESVGFDIDPLSVMIARAKLEAPLVGSERLASVAAEVSNALQVGPRSQLSLFGAHADGSGSAQMRFPAWLLKNRNMTGEVAGELGRDIAEIRAAIGGRDPVTQNLLRVLMSDAISRKIRMRFLGTGVGRFALSFAATPLAVHFTRSLHRYVRVAAAAEWMRETLGICFADAAVIQADTRCLPERDNRFDVLVTSPPYLPASSGRESYAKARAPSLIALGMRTHEDVDLLVDESIGAMDSGEHPFDDLSPEERRLVDWLSSDPLRGIKAAPTARYFLDMRTTFSEMFRVLRPGAMAAVVSGKTSTFYQFSTRTPLYVAETAEMLADEARRSGFDVERLLDIELDKTNLNARPRSLDAYFETVIMLRKPAR